MVNDVFDLGANREAAWCVMGGDEDKMWWLPQGSGAEVDPKMVPVRPDLVAEVLGVGDWVGRPREVPVARGGLRPGAGRVPDHDGRARQRGWHGAGFVARPREVFADRRTLMIQRIVFYGAGRPPGGRRRTSRSGSPSRGRSGGVAPSDIVLSLPLSRATMRFALRTSRRRATAFRRTGVSRFQRSRGFQR